MIITGRADEAFPVIDQAIALDPRSPTVADSLHWRCLAHLVLGHYDDAIAACEKAVALEDWWARYAYLAAAYAQKGDMAKAATAKAELLKRQPEMSIARYKAMRFSNNPIYLQQRETHLYAGLRKAGIPEQ